MTALAQAPFAPTGSGKFHNTLNFKLMFQDWKSKIKENPQISPQ
jgi:hypothetical protein